MADEDAKTTFVDQVDVALLRAALDHEPVGVALLSLPDLTYEYVNPAFHASAPGKEMTGKRNIDVFPEMQYLAEKVLPVLSETGRPWREEEVQFRFRRSPAGPLETTFATVYVEAVTVDGKAHLLVTATETTERVRLRRELDRMRERLLRIVEAITQGFVAIDVHRRVTFINRTAAEVVGIDPAEAVGRDVSEVLPAVCVAKTESACLDAIRVDAEARFEIPEGPGGRAYDVHVFPTPEGAVIVLADITDRKRWEAEREEALRSERRTRELSERLNEIQRLVTSTLEFDEILQRVIRASAEITRADAAGVGLYDDDRYANRALYGLPQDLVGTPVEFKPSDALGVVRATGEPMVVADARDDARFDPSLVERFGVRSLMLVPFSEKGRVVGGLGLYRRRVEPFAPEEVDAARKIAATTGLAAENARLYGEQQRALRLAEALDDINQAIHSSLDYDEVMQRALDEATRVLGASAGTVFIGLDSASEARYVSGLPKAVLGQRFEADVFPFSRILEETKDPVAVGPGEMGSLMNRAVARMFGVRSLLAIPLVSRGDLVGGIGLIYRAPHEFSAEDVGFARRFGASVSLALENADLYRRQERVADTLQEALLTLPDRVEGLEIAHLYHSAAEAAKVGGDFYDLFELEHHTVGLTVGDISGKGLDAAVLTSLVKNAIRVQATGTGNTPADALRITNEVLLRGSNYETFATAFFALMDLESGRLTYCNAGHTTTLIVSDDGTVERLRANSPLVGALGGMRFNDSATTLTPDATMLMYTDGVIEARGREGLFGEERLVELVARTGDGSPANMVRRVIDDVVSFAGGELSDDVAILAIRRT